MGPKQSDVNGGSAKGLLCGWIWVYGLCGACGNAYRCRKWARNGHWRGKRITERIAGLNARTCLPTATLTA